MSDPATGVLGLLFWVWPGTTVVVRTRKAAVREAWKSEGDRGAVLFILILFLVIFIAVATLAVDLAADGARAQDLQNTSDAAALAGVVKFQEQILAGASRGEAEDAARDMVETVMELNGIDASADTIDVVITVSEDGTQLRVRISDEDPDQFLPTELLGENLEPRDSTITPSATAEFSACEATCSLRVKIEKSFGATNAPGDGDGYKPILIDQKLYAINHNSTDRKIVCISTITQQPCWPEGAARTAYANSVNYFDPTPELPHTAVVGSRIYWAGTSATSGFRLFCWETASGLDVPCADSVTLNSSLSRVYAGADGNMLSRDKDESRGGGTFTVFGDKVLRLAMIIAFIAGTLRPAQFVADTPTAAIPRRSLCFLPVARSRATMDLRSTVLSTRRTATSTAPCTSRTPRSLTARRL